MNLPEHSFVAIPFSISGQDSDWQLFKTPGTRVWGLLHGQLKATSPNLTLNGGLYRE